jgi:hypothetical protein
MEGYPPTNGRLLALRWKATRSPMEGYSLSDGRLLADRWTSTRSRMDGHSIPDGRLLALRWTATRRPMEEHSPADGRLLALRWTSTRSPMESYSLSDGRLLALRWTATRSPMDGHSFPWRCAACKRVRRLAQSTHVRSSPAPGARPDAVKPGLRRRRTRGVPRETPRRRQPCAPGSPRQGLDQRRGVCGLLFQPRAHRPPLSGQPQDLPPRATCRAAAPRTPSS